MKVVVLQENLNKAVSVVGRLIQTNNSLPILGNILLQTNEGRLELQATNLEIAVSYKIGAKIEKPGSISVPARLFQELIHSLPNDKIQLVQSKDNLEIHTNQLNSIINGINANDFPKIPKVAISQEFNLSTQQFLEGLEYVLPAVSLDESRPVLSGIYCKIDDSKLIFAATDSYRLAQYVMANTNLKPLTIIIPYRTVLELIRIVKNENISDIKVGVSQNEIVFSTKDFQLTSQLIDGSYPDYTKIIPEKSETSISVDKSDLINSLKIASLFSKESAHTITLKTEKDTLLVYSEGSQVGTNTSKLPVKITGEHQEINLNARYLIDSLSAIPAKTIQIKLNGKLDPCIVQSQIKKEEQNIHIIMPLRS